MVIKVIMGQRKENYVGEYAPEALEVMSEFDYDENAVWLHDKLEALQKEPWWKSVKIVNIKVDDQALMRILRSPNEIVGEISS